MQNENRKCSDCEGQMAPIQIVDKLGGAEGEIAGLEYTAIDAEPSFWTGSFTKSGSVESYMCNRCGAIRLFGVNKI